MKKIYLIALLCLVLSLAGCSNATKQTNNPDEIIKIGFLGPLTGDVASLGEMQTNIINQFLKANPTINGQKVEVVFQDGQCSGDVARSGAEALMNDPEIQVIVGGACSGEVLAIADLANEKEVLVISATATSPEITTAGDYIFRTVPADDQNAVKLVEHFSVAKLTKAAVVSQLTDFGQAYRKDVIKNLDAAGISTVLDETYGDEVTDFRSLIQKIKDSGADGVFILSNFPTTGGVFVRQFGEAGLKSQLYGVDALSGGEFIENAGKFKENMIISLFATDTTNTEVNEKLTEYTTLYGAEPSFPNYYTTTYDTMSIVFKAIEEVGNNGTAIKDYLYKNSFNELSGKIEFDNNGETSLIPTLQMYKGDELVIYE